jgi:Bacterial Ig-like domain (group 1)/PQQ enzyme repeat
MPLAPRPVLAVFRFPQRLAAVAAAAIFCASLFCANLATAQVSVTTYHNDNSRTGQNTSETLLTPSNVNSTQFGKLFASVTLDSWVAGQPLYVPNVTISGTTHNVVYVATLNNSVYAFDADSGSLLWNANFGTPTPYASLCADNVFAQSPSGGAGIIGTPVIDPVAGIIYFLAKTGDGNVSPFALTVHAVDITTGLDEVGSPTTINPTSGPTFYPEYQMNRPALLLNNGMLYVALGSTGCLSQAGFPPINNHGYLFAFTGSNLALAPSFFITTPGVNNGGIWQSGAGPAADAEGNVYFETANAPYDYYTGGEDFGDSVVKVSSTAGFLDYFTPYNQAYLNTQDLDLSSSGPLLLPDQTSGPTHVMVATGKAEEIYIINRDAMGEYCNNCTFNSNVMQDILPPSGYTGCVNVNGTKTCTYGSPSYWNNNVYIPGVIAPINAYSLTNAGNGANLSSLPTSQTTGTYSGFGSPSISANGTTNGIVWSMSWGSGTWTQYNGTLHAYNATNLGTEVYNSTQAANSRDTVGNVLKFITPTIANGKVYTATQTQLLVYGLLFPLKTSAGNKQSGAAGLVLPIPLTIQVSSPYTGKPATGVPVTFSDNGAGGVFGTPSTTTDSTGKASTTYTLPTKTGTYTITASGSTAVSTTFSETAVSGVVGKLTLVSGGSQSGTVETALTQPIIVAAKDAYGNLVANASVTFSDNGLGGIFTPNPVITASNGRASVNYMLPAKATSISVTASVSLPLLTVSEKSVASTASSVNYVSGNNQSAQPKTPLTNPLVVAVKDQYGNLVAGAAVTFADNGAGGTFSNNGVATTASNGRATMTYTTSANAGTVNVSASVPGATPFSFTETVQ